MISFLNPDIGAAHSVELLFVFNLRGPGTASSFNGTNIIARLVDRIEAGSNNTITIHYKISEEQLLGTNAPWAAQN
jgi:hypothetical protein